MASHVNKEQEVQEQLKIARQLRKKAWASLRSSTQFLDQCDDEMERHRMAIVALQTRKPEEEYRQAYATLRLRRHDLRIPALEKKAAQFKELRKLKALVKTMERDIKGIPRD